MMRDHTGEIREGKGVFETGAVLGGIEPPRTALPRSVSIVVWYWVEEPPAGILVKRKAGQWALAG